MLSQKVGVAAGKWPQGGSWEEQGIRGGASQVISGIPQVSSQTAFSPLPTHVPGNSTRNVGVCLQGQQWEAAETLSQWLYFLPVTPLSDSSSRLKNFFPQPLGTAINGWSSMELPWLKSQQTQLLSHKSWVSPVIESTLAMRLFQTHFTQWGKTTDHLRLMLETFHLKESAQTEESLPQRGAGHQRA